MSKPKNEENVQGAAPKGTNDRIQHVLGVGETRSSFVREAVMAHLEARERVLQCHDYSRDPSRQGYYCLNCGNPRMHHLAQDVKRAAETQVHVFEQDPQFEGFTSICVCGKHLKQH